MDGAQVRVLKEAHKVGLGGLLQGTESRALEAQVRLDVLRNLANEALERQLANEQLRALLVSANLAQRHRAWAVTVRLLDAAGRRRRLACGLGGEFLAGCLATERLACGLLRASHVHLDTRVEEMAEGGGESRKNLL